MVTQVLKPSALRLVVSSSLLNSETSTEACVDGQLNYTCDCHAVFDAVSISNVEMCLEINECDEWNGAAACFPGSCGNLIDSFSCACPTRYKIGVGEHGET